jgi:hypothetical protein
VPAAERETTFVRVVAEKGLALQSVDRQNLLPLPHTRASDQERDYVATQKHYGGLFHLLPASPNVDARILTLTEKRNRNLTFAARLNCIIRSGELRTLRVHLLNWPGQEVHIEAPQAISRRDRHLAPLHRVWTFDLEPGITDRYQLRLTGSLPLEGGEALRMPDVSVEGASAQERWIAILGPELSGESPQGLAPSTGFSRIREYWPSTAAQLRQAGGSAWKIVAADWNLALRVQPKLTQISPIQVLLDEQAAGMADGGRWLHRATYVLYHEAGADVRLLLPAGATLVRVTLDGSDVTPFQQSGLRLWLPLTGTSGACTLRVCWMSDPARESLEKPDLQEPVLEGVTFATERPALWTVETPPGYRFFPRHQRAIPESSADPDLRRAGAQLMLSGLLAERAAGKNDENLQQQLLAAQMSFYRHCRDAEHRLAISESSQESSGPDAQAEELLRRLQTSNKLLAQTHDFERLRSRAVERAMVPMSESTMAPAGLRMAPFLDQAEDALLGERGLPTYWQAAESDKAPHLQLTSLRAWRARQSLGYSALLMVLLLMIWFVSHLPRVVTLLLRFWPEEMLLAGCATMLLLGFGWEILVLAILGMGARMIYFVHWSRALVQRPTPGVAGSGSGRTPMP